MAIFKTKAPTSTNKPKAETVFHGGKVVAVIKGTIETEDQGVIDALTALGYERLDVEKAADPEPEVQAPPEAAEPTEAKKRRKIGGK